MEEDKDFIDFEFNGRWASEFKLLAVSDGDRYTSPFYGSVSPNTSTLVGKVGVHKWKTQVGEKEFNIQIAYDDVDLGTLRKIKEWLNPFVIGKLVFKEEPYKYYWVSLSEDPQISFLPFRTEDLIVDGKSYKKGVYKGDFTLNFICVDNYGYSDWSSFDENFDYLVNEIKGENFITFDDSSDNNLILTKIEGGFAQETKSAIPYTNVEGNDLQLTDVENVDTQNWIIKGGHHQVQTDEEKTTVNGESISISDVDDSKPADIVIKGNHYQATREGYNLYNVKDARDFSVGVIVGEDDWITITADNSSGTSTKYMNFFTNNLDLKTNTDYAIILEIKQVTGTGKLNLINTFQSTGQFSTSWISDFTSITSNKYKIIGKTVSDMSLSTFGLRSYVAYAPGEAGTITLRVSVLEDTSVDLDTFVYEQYGISPSLDYPSEAETVGSNVNGFDLISYYNTAPVVSATKQLLNNGIKLNFEAKADAYIGTVLNEGETLNKNWRSGCVAVEPNTTYTIQVSSAPKCYISYLDENYKAIKGFTQFFGNVTFTTDARTHYIYFRFGYNNSASILTFYEFTNIKIEKGSVATPYSPFGMGSVEIDVVNKNLLDKNNEKKGITINAAGVEESNGARSITQYITVDKNKKVLYVNWSGKTGKKNPGYTILLSYDSNKKLITRQPTFNETSSKNWAFDISNASFIKVTYDDLQINNGDFGVENTIISYEKTEYEAHQSQTVIMPIQQEMLTGDYIENVEHHEWKKLILNNDVAIDRFTTSDSNAYRFVILNIDVLSLGVGEKADILCNKLNVVKATETYEKVEGISASTNSLIIYIDECKNMTVEEFRAYLKRFYDEGNPFVIYYKSINSTDLPLTLEQKTAREQIFNTKLYSGITNITNNSSYPAIIELNYNITREEPSPEWPSEVKTVGSNVNELKLKNGKNIKTYGLDVSIDNDIITINGTANDYYPTFLISGDGEIETRLGTPNINANPNWYNSIALAKRDYTLKFEYIGGDGGTAHRPYIFIHTSDGKNLEFSQGNSTKVKNYTGEIDGISFYVENNQTFNNYKFRVYVVKGTYTKDTIPLYSPFGMGSVEIDVVNSNLLDFNVAQDSRVTVNEDGTLTINGAGGFSLNIDKLQLKAGITYYQKVELISGSISGSNINNTFLSFAGAGAWISSENFSQTNLTKDTEKTTIWINASVIFNNAVIRIWANTDKSDFIKHQSKTTIIPTQQELLEGDYIDKSKEYHKWEKIIIDTSKLMEDVTNEEGKKRYKYEYNKVIKKSDITHNVAYSNMFKLLGEGQTYWNFKGFTIVNNNIYIYNEGEPLTEFKSKLTDKQLVFYAQLETSTKLELTTEQKTAMNKLNTSQFYPNITNLSLSNSVAKVNFDYNGYDGMPSPRYPSDFQVVKDSVDITISNKNLFDFNKLNTQNTNLTIQGKKLIGNNVPNIVIGAAPDSTALMKKTLLPGTYTVSFDITSESSSELLNCYFCCQQVDGTYNNYYNGKATILLPNEKNRVFYEYKITKAVQKISIVGYLQGNTNLEISNIAVIEGTDNKYTEYKEQVISMPVQQELFKDDYIEDVEHHEWKKIIVDGINYGSPSYVFPNGMFVLHNLKEAQAIKDAIPQKDWAVSENNVVCSHLPTTTTYSIQVTGKKGISNNPSGLIIMKIDDSTADNSTWTSEAVNEYLQQQNEKGQPLTVWYKTTEPYDLELTEDQADIKENCKDFVYSYPGANYISANTTLPKLSISYMPEQDLAIDFVADGSNLLNSSSFYYTNEIYLKSFKDKETGNPDTSGITSSRAEYLFNAGNQPANLNLTFDYIPPQQGAPLEINIDKVQLTNNGWKTLEKKYTSISLEYFEAFKPFTDLLKKAYSIDDLSNLPSNWQNDWQLEINSEIKEIYFKNKHNKDLVISLNKFNKKQEFLQLCGSNFVDYSKPFPTLITEVEESAIADTYFNKVYLTATAQDYRLKNINLEWKHTYL